MRASGRMFGLVLAGLIATLGCFDRDLTDIRPGTTTGVTIRVEQIGVVRVDIIVMVDNSGSMAQEQIALTQRFPELIEELIDPEYGPGEIDPATGRRGHPPVEDLNVAVISSDMGTAGYTVPTCINRDVGDNGCFLHEPGPGVPGCAATYHAFLSRNETNAGAYLADEMAADFTCIATLGTGGCGFEQQFKAMRAATSTNPSAGTCNTLFLRPDALLALIFVTDEEDCSVRPDHTEMFDPARTADLGHLNLRCFLNPTYVESVGDYVTAFRGLKPDVDANKIVIGMIIGVPPDAPACIGDGNELESCLGLELMVEKIDLAAPTQLVPSCTTTMGMAFPPRRFVQLAQQFGSNAIVDSICKPDWRDAIKGITDALVERLPSTCFPRDLTFDTEFCTADCKVVETLNNGRDCEADPACTSCPSATIDDVHNLLPCTDAGGNECQPLKRDLGLTEMSDGSFRRLCLVRQATRYPIGGGNCGEAEPGLEGWYYLTREQSTERCPQVIFGSESAGSLIEDGSVAELRCLSELCPQDLWCGPEGIVGQSPTIPCCATVDFDGDRRADPAHCSTAPGRGVAGTCVEGACSWRLNAGAWVCE